MSGAEIAAEVAAGLAEAGAETGNGTSLTGTLTRPAALGDTPWDAAPNDGPSTWTVTLVVSRFTTYQIDGDLIRADDVKFLVEATGPVPMLNDTLTVGGVVYTVKNVWPLTPGGVVVLFTVQGRR